MKVEPRVQFNKRVSGSVRTAVKITAAILPEISEDRILEDALLLYYGSTDPEILNRQKKVMAELKSLKGGKLLPFESPLAPSNHNAFHNGIVGVAGSKPADSTNQLEFVINKAVLGHVGRLHKSRSVSAGSELSLSE